MATYSIQPGKTISSEMKSSEHNLIKRVTFIPFAIFFCLQVRSCLHPRGRGFPKEIKIRKQGLWDHSRVCLS